MRTAVNWNYKEEYEKDPTLSHYWRADAVTGDNANWIQVPGYVRSITDHKVSGFLKSASLGHKYLLDVSKHVNLSRKFQKLQNYLFSKLHDFILTQCQVFPIHKIPRASRQNPTSHQIQSPLTQSAQQVKVPAKSFKVRVSPIQNFAYDARSSYRSAASQKLLRHHIRPPLPLLAVQRHQNIVGATPLKVTLAFPC
jgi:hypothetical protein